jgi:hypothetical protein
MKEKKERKNRKEGRKEELIEIGDHGMEKPVEVGG